MSISLLCLKEVPTQEAKRFVQDGCAIQNSVAMKEVRDEIGAFVFCISPRSPDLNPVENVFHLVNM